MFKSEEEAYLKTSSFESKSYTLGVQNGFLLILLLSSLKSDMKETVPFFLGITNIGAAYSESSLRFRAPMFTNLLNSV